MTMTFSPHIHQLVKWLISLHIWLKLQTYQCSVVKSTAADGVTVSLITFSCRDVVHLQCGHNWPSWSRGGGQWGRAAPGPAWPCPGQAAWPGSTGRCGGGRSPGCYWTPWRAPPPSAGRSPAGSAAHTGTAGGGDRENMSWRLSELRLKTQISVSLSGDKRRLSVLTLNKRLFVFVSLPVQKPVRLTQQSDYQAIICVCVSTLQ